MNFYFDSVKALDRLDAKQGSVKGVISSVAEKDRKRTAALVIETLKYKSVLLEIIRSSDLLKHERMKITSQNLALVLVHDLLFSKGIQAGDGPIKQAIMRHKTRLHAELTKLKIKRGVQSTEELAQGADHRADLIPRYVRVNTLLWSVDEALAYFRTKGYNESGDPLTSKLSVQRDHHVPGLLLFHPTTSFLGESPLNEGKIILQDKASCFPAVVLAPPAEDESYAIDATAAPGNKTTFLSSLMQGRGKLFAFERDRKRFATLKKMVATARCTNIEPLNADFLQTDPTDVKFGAVTHILLDPSCSGSGIVNRLDYLLDTDEREDDSDEREERLQKLASFQLLMIRHAMRFPAVKKIVYSTCSVHVTENEEVVCKAASSIEAKEGGFTIADRKEVLPAWHRRGMAETMGPYSTHADGLVRCVPGEDHTNGFFVSCFVRNGGLSVNEGSTQQKSRHETAESGIQRAEKRRAISSDDPEKPPSLDLNIRYTEDRALNNDQGSTRKRKKRKKKVS